MKGETLYIGLGLAIDLGTHFGMHHVGYTPVFDTLDAALQHFNEDEIVEVVAGEEYDDG